MNRLLGVREGSPVGLVLSGGGARGAFQVGVWKVLYEEGLGGLPDVVSGTSAGAINGALIAAGLSPREMLDFWLDLADKPPVEANAEFFESLDAAIARIASGHFVRSFARRKRELLVGAEIVRKHGLRGSKRAMVLEFLMTARFDVVSKILDGITTSYLFSTASFRTRLERVIGPRGISSRHVKLALNTVDVRTGGVVRIVNHPPDKKSAAAARRYRVHERITPEMVLASASIPLLFNGVRVGQELLWDGGLLVNTPIAPAVALGARRLVPVLVTAGGVDATEEPPTFGAAIERLADAFLENAYVADRKLLLERNALAAKLPDELQVVDLYRPIRPTSSRTFNAGSYLFFEREPMLRMYEAGIASARAWLARGPEQDERSLDL